ncbi:MAG: hypothetical protein GX657_02460 [Chloroflexi bacterium]|nr:hypothetical protein [Chloroflexota bacterium]
MTVDVQLTDDRLRDLPKRLWEAGDRLVRRTALDIERRAKAGAPVDTGFLRNSIYTVTSQGSGYDRALGHAERTDAKRRAGQRKSAATGQWVDVAGAMMEEAVGAGFLSAIVAVGAEYGVFVEYGTLDQAAQPYLEPAVEDATDAWEEGLEKLFDEAMR